MKTICITVTDEQYQLLKQMNASELIRKLLDTYFRNPEDYERELRKRELLARLREIEESEVQYSGKWKITSVRLDEALIEVVRKQGWNMSRIVNMLLYHYLKDYLPTVKQVPEKEEIVRTLEELSTEEKVERAFKDLKRLAETLPLDEFLERCRPVVRILEELLETTFDESYLRQYWETYGGGRL